MVLTATSYPSFLIQRRKASLSLGIEPPPEKRFSSFMTSQDMGYTVSLSLTASSKARPLEVLHRNMDTPLKRSIWGRNLPTVWKSPMVISAFLSFDAYGHR